MKTLLAVALAVAAACGGTASAQTRPAPGLWEHQLTVRSGGGEMEASMAQMREQMAKMSPQERAQMETMMKQMGVGMPTAQGMPITVRVCLTPEEVARDELPPPEARCSQFSKERSGNTYRFKFTCSGDPPMSGEGEYTFTSDKAHSGRSVATTTGKGKAERVEMQLNAKWLGADCGSVKPRGERAGGSRK